MASLEAMASGVPLVATDVPATNELVRDGENGLLVPLDDPKAVARATERVFSDAALRRKLIAGGLETAKRFSLEKVVESHLKMYAEAVMKARDDRKP
jgi:glycosyltransferase involved in cell wall biosynthesis